MRTLLPCVILFTIFISQRIYELHLPTTQTKLLFKMITETTESMTCVRLVLATIAMHMMQKLSEKG